MKPILLALLIAASALADVNFYFTDEPAPYWMPGDAFVAGGIMVLVEDPADGATVCASYTAADGTANVKCVSAIEDGYGYSVAGFETGVGFTITRLEVTVGDVTKSIDNPVPGVDY